MKTKIGGQAVIEGVMMRGATCEALSVRDENGVIRTETRRLPLKKPWYRKVPFLRGVVNLVISLIDGMKILGKSAEVMAEDETDGDNGKGMSAIMALSVFLGLALAVALFILLPTQLTKWIMQWTDITEVKWARSLIEGALKLLILVGYMSSVTLMKEIRRVFMYHGAEHKTIACFEAELPLTCENVKKCSRYHDRCGTSFIVFVVVLSVIVMFAVEAIFYACGAGYVMDLVWARSLIKIAMLPLTAGISYEMLMLLAASNFILFRPLKWLGKQFQKLTTREPDDEMCMVAITAFQKVLEMDADTTLGEEHFPDPVMLSEFRSKAAALCDFTVMEKCDLDWILSSVMNVRRGELKDDMPVSFGKQLKIESMIRRCSTGEPLQYVLGNSEFYGRLFSVTPDVLIPRMETELVCEKALEYVKRGSKVLDLCCGSGVIGITAALEKGAKVTLADISSKALAVAKANAKSLKAKVGFKKSDMFGSVKGKYDVIVCNPPYVRSDVIATLDAKVKDNEPLSALDGGADGMDFYRIIARDSKKYLSDGGVMVLEIGYDQGEEVKQLFGGKFETEVFADYGGNDRIAVLKFVNGSGDVR